MNLDSQRATQGMDQRAQATATAGVLAAEAICGLPAVPTQDWCGRAARALLAIGSPATVTVLIVRSAGNGTVGTVDQCGIAATQSPLTDLSTRATPSLAFLDVSRPPYSRLHLLASATDDLGWSPAALASSGVNAAALSAAGPNIARDPAAIRARWSDVGARDVLVGAVPVGAPENGRYLIVEMALAGGEGAPDADVSASLLGIVLPMLARRACMAFEGTGWDEASCLTSREETVLEHLIRGLSVREIAEHTGRSPHTVHDHVKSLHRKLNASSRGELVARALGHRCDDTAPAIAGRDAGSAEADTNGVRVNVRRGENSAVPLV